MDDMVREQIRMLRERHNQKELTICRIIAIISIGLNVYLIGLAYHVYELMMQMPPK